MGLGEVWYLGYSSLFICFVKGWAYLSRSPGPFGAVFMVGCESENLRFAFQRSSCPMLIQALGDSDTVQHFNGLAQ